MTYDPKFAIAQLVKELKLLMDGESCDHDVGICWCSAFVALEYGENTLRQLNGEPTLCGTCGRPEGQPNRNCPEGPPTHPGGRRRGMPRYPDREAK